MSADPPSTSDNSNKGATSSNLWDEEKVTSLITFYRIYPELWDKKSKDYKNKEKRSEALKTIGQVLNVDVTEVERKIHVLQGQFRKTRNRVVEMKKKGISDEIIFNNIWYGYKQLSFLESRYKTLEEETLELQTQNDQNRDNSKGNDEQGEDSNYEGGNEVDIYVGCGEAENGEFEQTMVEGRVNRTYQEEMIEERNRDNCNGRPIDSYIEPRRRYRLTDGRRRFIRPNTGCHLPETVDLIREVRGEPKDEMGLFGEQVAMKMRKLSGMARVEAQHKINCILYEYEMAMFKETTGDEADPLFIPQASLLRQRNKFRIKNEDVEIL